MYRGYIKLYRKSLDAGWIKNPELWAFWTWCLLKSSHKGFDAIVGSEKISLMPGQFITGRKKASEETGLTEQEIRTILKFLKREGNLTIKSTNKYSIITIVNWAIYQGSEKEFNQQNNKPITNKEPAANHIQALKNEKDCKDINSPLVGDKSPTCPHQEIIDLYHKILPELPAVKVWTSKRKGYLRSRWTEDKDRQSISWWEQYFLKVKKSPFLMGNVNSFKATLEWIINQANMVKILEGNYEGGNNEKSTFGRTGQPARKAGRVARSDGQPYPVDFDG